MKTNPGDFSGKQNRSGLKSFSRQEDQSGKSSSNSGNQDPDKADNPLGNSSPQPSEAEPRDASKYLVSRQSVRTLNYLPVYSDFFASQHLYCILYGGAGSGKSVAAAQKLFIRCLREPGLKVLVVRKTASALKRSVFAQLEAIIKEAQIQHSVTFRRAKADTSITFHNGSQILFTGCFDADRLKSIQGLSCIWIEEATELTEQDFTQLTLRIRGKTEGYHQYLLTFNPTDQAHWLYNRFFESTQTPTPSTGASPTRSSSRREASGRPRDLLKKSSKSSAHDSPPFQGGLPANQAGVAEGRGGLSHQKAIVSDDTFILRSTFSDNSLLEAEYTRLLNQTLRRDSNAFRVYALGEWGHLRRGGEFYKHFDTAKHVMPTTYKKALPLHLTFDFNLNPYMTLNVWQVEKTELRQIDEFCLENPRNSTPELCKAFLEKYGRHQAGVKIYGDPTGAKGNTQTTERTSDYNVIMKELAALCPQKMVKASAPPVAKRGQFINQLLLGTIEGYAIKVSPTCRNTIKDYQSIQEDADGSKIKEMHTDRNGIRSQKYGHCSDANDYFLCTILENHLKAMGKPVGPLPPALLGYDRL